MVIINGIGANVQAMANKGIEYHPFNDNGTEFADIIIKADAGNNDTKIVCWIINDDEHSRAISHEAQLKVQGELSVSLFRREGVNID